MKTTYPQIDKSEYTLKMLSSHKNKQSKGKAVSSTDAASLQNAKGVADFTINPSNFSVFKVTEDVGVPKKAMTTEYTLKGVFEGMSSEVTVFVPRSFLSNNGKLALRQMGATGARLVVSRNMVSRERQGWSGHNGGGGYTATYSSLVTEFTVSAILP